MRSIQIDGLAREQLHGLAVIFSQCVVWQVRMEVERRNIIEQAQLVEVFESGKRGDIFGAFDQRDAVPTDSSPES